jgi:hypothetical protein
MQHKMLHPTDECKVNMGYIQLESTQWNYTNRKEHMKTMIKKTATAQYYIIGKVFSNGVYTLSSSFLDTDLFSKGTYTTLYSIRNCDSLFLIKYPTYLKMFQIQIISLIRIILVRHTSYNVDDLKAPASVINK